MRLRVNSRKLRIEPLKPSVFSNAGGYATASSGVGTVDECGLQFLMAMKQYEYLLLCLPINQRMELKMNGLSSSVIIWAQHSETEAELLNAVPSLQKANPTWDELRNLGIAWWLKDSASLKTCLEKVLSKLLTFECCFFLCEHINRHQSFIVRSGRFKQ
ncbi:hypothetical protein COOONC_27583 [Cooperia oncophora]